jgi:predicted ATPase
VDELATLGTTLPEPDTRLVTLLGLGGSGKTRLALEVGRRFAESDRQALVEQAPLTFPHGIVFVPLEGIESVDGLVAALAHALQLRLEGGQEQLLEFLRRKQLLLILDSMEHLLAGGSFLAEIIRIAPGIKILATSRERLHLLGERIVPLAGLPYPEHDREPPLPGSSDLETWLATYPALQLLAEGVGRVRGCSASTREDLCASVELCHLVDGLPLALELAASWADTLSLKDILLEAQRSLDFLQADWPNLHERQRSIRAVFDASWQWLTPSEQAMFSALTVFRGGFTREAAGHVVVEAEAIPRLLAALVRKSFLQYDQERRYRIHELLRQYGAERLVEVPSRADQVADRHSAYYLGELQRREADLLGSQQQAALLALESESENIRAGWTWAAERAQIERLDQTMEAAYYFYWYGSRYWEGQAAFRAAAAAASAASSAAEEITDKATCLRVCLRASAWQSRFEKALGNGEVARRIHQKALTVLEDPALVGRDTRLERAILALTNGFTLASVDFEQARGQFKESYALFHELELQWGMAWALTNLGNMSAILGDHRDARGRLEEGLVIWRALGNRPGISFSLGFLAYLARMEGRFEDAGALAQQAYAVSLEQGTRTRTGMNHLFLATALEHWGRLSEARAILEEGLALAVDHGNVVQHVQVHSALVRVGLHQGRYEEARVHAETGLELARANGPRFIVGLNLVLQGCLDLAEGDFASARRHLQDGIDVYRDCGQTDDLSWNHALLALAARGQGETADARRHLLDACQIAVDLGVVPPLLWALPVAALLLADRGQRERAVELFALASRYPLVANSRWFEDVAGRHLAATAETLPAAVAAEAAERGQACDIHATVAGLLTELRT